jgi:GT2 family glycosyltransferase
MPGPGSSLSRGSNPLERYLGGALLLWYAPARRPWGTSQRTFLGANLSEQTVRSFRIAVAVATTGRAQLLRETLPIMLDQDRKADRVVVVGVTPADVEGLASLDHAVETLLAERGLPRQRNAALAATKHDCDAIVFFDDDFIPSRDFLARVEQIFLAHPDVAAVTGCLAIDGVNFGGCELSAAQAQLREAERNQAHHDVELWDVNHLYGCNMAARLPVAADVGFDERLPLYAWQEDRDFSRRLNAHGRIVRVHSLRGAHMGVTQARSPGVKLGYSQVANPLYLLGKGTMRPLETTLFVGRIVVANLVKTLKPEPWIDRAGRLRGNALALFDAARGVIAPERILEL